MSKLLNESSKYFFLFFFEWLTDSMSICGECQDSKIMTKSWSDPSFLHSIKNDWTFFLMESPKVQTIARLSRNLKNPAVNSLLARSSFFFPLTMEELMHAMCCISHTVKHNTGMCRINGNRLVCWRETENVLSFVCVSQSKKDFGFSTQNCEQGFLKRPHCIGLLGTQD